MISTVRQTKPLVIHRIFNAPASMVWKACTEPARLMQWWGPKNFTAPVCKTDLRPGGEYHFCMQSFEGHDYWSKGVFKEIIPQTRLVMTDCFADEKGNTVPASYYDMPGEWPMELLIIYTFEEEDGKTKFSLQHLGIPEGEMMEVCREGWHESFDKLAKSLL